MITKKNFRHKTQLNKIKQIEISISITTYNKKFRRFGDSSLNYFVH